MLPKYQIKLTHLFYYQSQFLIQYFLFPLQTSCLAYINFHIIYFKIFFKLRYNLIICVLKHYTGNSRILKPLSFIHKISKYKYDIMCWVLIMMLCTNADKPCFVDHRTEGPANNRLSAANSGSRRAAGLPG